MLLLTGYVYTALMMRKSEGTHTQVIHALTELNHGKAAININYSQNKIEFRHCVNQDLEENYILGWKKSFERINTQLTCEFMVISQLLGGQF